MGRLCVLFKVLRHPLCTGGGSSWQNSGKPDSMMDMSCTMLMSLTVATLMGSQTVSQQKGSEEGQWQCFWKSQNPMPVLG